MPPAAALAGSAIGGIVGGIAQGNAASDAAKASAAAAQQASAVQGKVYDDQKSAWDPYQKAGGAALSQLQDPSLLRSFGQSDFQQDPGYQFRLQQGQQALDRSAASRGGLFSGAQMKAAQGFGQDMASQEYQNAYNRFNQDQSNRFNRLSSLTGYGTMANQSLGQAGQNYADNMSNIALGNAKTQGQAGMYGASGFANTLSGLGKMGMDYANYNQPVLNTNMNYTPMASTAQYNAPPAPLSFGMNYSFNK